MRIIGGWSPRVSNCVYGNAGSDKIQMPIALFSSLYTCKPSALPYRAFNITHTHTHIHVTEYTRTVMSYSSTLPHPCDGLHPPCPPFRRPLLRSRERAHRLDLVGRDAPHQRRPRGAGGCLHASRKWRERRSRLGQRKVRPSELHSLSLSRFTPLTFNLSCGGGVGVTITVSAVVSLSVVL